MNPVVLAGATERELEKLQEETVQRAKTDKTMFK
jgi:hypothetical protein